MNGHEGDVREEKVIEEEVRVTRGRGTATVRVTGGLVTPIQPRLQQVLQHLSRTPGHHRVSASNIIMATQLLIKSHGLKL